MYDPVAGPRSDLVARGAVLVRVRGMVRHGRSVRVVAPILWAEGGQKAHFTRSSHGSRSMADTT